MWGLFGMRGRDRDRGKDRIEGKAWLVRRELVGMEERRRGMHTLSRDRTVRLFPLPDDRRQTSFASAGSLVDAMAPLLCTETCSIQAHHMK